MTAVRMFASRLFWTGLATILLHFVAPASWNAEFSVRTWLFTATIWTAMSLFVWLVDTRIHRGPRKARS